MFSLASEDEKLATSALATTALLFQNDEQAIKLLKTKVVSNLIKYRASQNEYVKSIVMSILDSAKHNSNTKEIICFL